MSRLISIRSWLAPVLIVALSQVVTFVCCTQPPQQHHTSDLIGRWKTDPYESQLGSSVSELCFTSDGSYSFQFQSQGGVARDDGKYSLQGRNIVLVSTSGSMTISVEQRGSDAFVLKENGNPPRLYRRVAMTCSH
jgi:hypothetical protein